MLNMLKYYKESFLSIIKNDFANEEQFASVIGDYKNATTPEEQKEVLENNKAIILELIESLDVDKNKKLSYFDRFSGKKEVFILKLISDLKITWNLASWVDKKLLKDKITAFIWWKGEILDQTKTYLAEHRSKFKPIEDTWEINYADKIESHQLFIPSKIEKNDYMKNPSLIKLLKRGDLPKVLSEMENVLPKDENWNIAKFTAYPIRNYISTLWRDINNVLEEYWYETDWVLDPEELAIVYRSLKDHVTNQIKIESGWMNDKQLINSLFDFDRNTKLESEVNAPIWELQLYYLQFKDLSTKDYNILFKNLWLVSYDNVKIMASQSLENTRDKVQSMIKSQIQNWKLAWELFVEWWTKKSNERVNNEVEDYKKEIGKQVYKMVDEKWFKLTPKSKPLVDSFIDSIIPDSIWFGNVAWKFSGWIGYNLDFLNEMTTWYLDATAWIWMAEKWPIFWANASLFEKWLKKYGTSIDLSLANFIIPYLTVWQDIYTWKTWWSINLEWWVWPWVFHGWIGYKRWGETSRWIEFQSEKFWETLQIAKEWILSWKSFEETSLYNQNSLDTEQDKSAYNQIKEVFENEIAWENDPQKRVKYLERLIDSIEKTYKNDKYFNAQWLMFTWCWLKVIFWVFPLPIPVPFVTWEYKSVKFSPAGHHVVEERENTKTSITMEDLKKIWWQLDIINWFKALSFPKDEINQISDSTGNAQVEEKDWKIYLSWVDPKDITINTDTDNWSFLRTLVIGLWKIDPETKAYIHTWFNWPITEDIQQESTPVSEVIDPLQEISTNELDQRLISISETFDHKTRRLDTWLMDPKNTPEQRWQWLKDLAEKMKNTDLQNLISETENSIENKEDKKDYIISSLVQSTKRSKDYFNWDIDKIKDNLDNLINKDRNRRHNFDGLLTSSLNEEAEIYYNELLKNKDNLWTLVYKWLAFDASASLHVWKKNKRIKWIDVLKWNLSMITANWELILIPITDKPKIDAFKTNINSLSLKPELRDQILEGLNLWNIKLYFYKDPEWFDDRIILYDEYEKPVDLSLSAQNSNEVYAQENRVTGLFGFGWTEIKNNNNSTSSNEQNWNNNWDDTKTQAENDNGGNVNWQPTKQVKNENDTTNIGSDHKRRLK